MKCIYKIDELRWTPTCFRHIYHLNCTAIKDCDECVYHPHWYYGNKDCILCLSRARDRHVSARCLPSVEDAFIAIIKKITFPVSFTSIVDLLDISPISKPMSGHSIYLLVCHHLETVGLKHGMLCLENGDVCTALGKELVAVSEKIDLKPGRFFNMDPDHLHLLVYFLKRPRDFLVVDNTVKRVILTGGIHVYDRESLEIYVRDIPDCGVRLSSSGLFKTYENVYTDLLDMEREGHLLVVSVSPTEKCIFRRFKHV